MISTATFTTPDLLVGNLEALCYFAVASILAAYFAVAHAAATREGSSK